MVVEAAAFEAHPSASKHNSTRRCRIVPPRTDGCLASERLVWREKLQLPCDSRQGKNWEVSHVGTCFRTPLGQSAGCSLQPEASGAQASTDRNVGCREDMPPAVGGLRGRTGQRLTIV